MPLSEEKEKLIKIAKNSQISFAWSAYRLHRHIFIAQASNFHRCSLIFQQKLIKSFAHASTSVISPLFSGGATVPPGAYPRPLTRRQRKMVTGDDVLCICMLYMHKEENKFFLPVPSVRNF